MNLIIIFISVFISFYSHANSFIDTNFEQSLGIEKNNKVNNDANIASKLYYEKLPSSIVPSSYQRFPKIIHQIWLSDKTIPEHIKYFMNTWRYNNPDWKYMLWTNDKIKNIYFESSSVLDQEKSLADRTRILKYEILNKYGGFYVDVNNENYVSLGDINNKYDCFIGIEPFNNESKSLEIDENIIGCRENHPFLTSIIKQINDKSKRFTIDLFIENIIHTENNIAFPSGYFNPIYNNQIIFRDETITFNHGKINLLINTKPYFEAALFNDSFVKGNSYRLYKRTYNKNYELYSILYNNFYPTKLSFNDKNLIPKIIHHIWDNDEQIPENIKANIASWKKNHPGWEYKLWDKEQSRDLLSGYNELLRDIKDNRERELFIKILILNNFGGIIVDLDLYSTKNLNELINKYSFFNLIDIPKDFEQDLFLSTNLLASTPNHIITKEILEKFTTEWRDFNTLRYNYTQEQINKMWNNYLAKKLNEKFNQHAFTSKAIAFPSLFFTNDKETEISFSYVNN